MSAMSSTALFSLNDLSPFERHGATVEPRESNGYNAGCHVKLPNGWTVSVQWGNGNYGSNYRNAPSTPPTDATEAEIAAFKGEGMVTWMDGDNVKGYCSMETVLHVIDLCAADKLLREYQPPVEMRADADQA